MDKDELARKFERLVPQLHGGHPEDCASARFQFKELCMENADAILSALQPITDSRPGVGEEIDYKHLLRMVVCHASGGYVDLDETGPLPMNEICVRISQHHNQIWQQANDSRPDGEFIHRMPTSLDPSLEGLADSRPVVGASSSKPRETGWLIEWRDGLGQTNWLRLSQPDDPGERPLFHYVFGTSNASEALRFARSHDAKALLHLVRATWPDAIVTDHEWVNPEEMTNEAG